MDYNKILQSRAFKFFLGTLFSLMVLAVIFGLGMFVGFKKAKFSYKWGENYQRNFAGPRGGFFENFSRDFMGKDFVDSHGTIGQIIKIDGLDIIIKDRDGVEKVIATNDATSIKRLSEDVKITDLKVDDYIITIGDPNDSGKIDARLIRIMPTPPPAVF
jgi:hypothetical protein